MSKLAVICVRGDSKGVKNKNARPLAGKPLIVHAVEQALDAAVFDAVAVSSDSAELLELARTAGANFLIERPAALASDTAPKVPAIVHCMQSAEEIGGERYSVVADLDATAPLRIAADIAGAVALLEATGAANVVTGSPARRSPYFNMVELSEEDRVALSKPPTNYIARRQDSPACFDLSPAVYVWSRACLLSGAESVLNEDTRLYLIPEERAIDIDTEADFKFVEFMMNERKSPA